MVIGRQSEADTGIGQSSSSILDWRKVACLQRALRLIAMAHGRAVSPRQYSSKDGVEDEVASAQASWEVNVDFERFAVVPTDYLC